MAGATDFCWGRGHHAYYTGSGALIIDCTAGRDFYVDTLSGNTHSRKNTNRLVLISKSGSQLQVR